LPDGLHIFKPKFPIWVNIGGFCNERRLYILWTFGSSHSHWVYFEAVWYILWPFGIFFPVLVHCTKRNLATLLKIRAFATPPTSAT
jgi:hypothetical protein